MAHSVTLDPLRRSEHDRQIAILRDYEGNETVNAAANVRGGTMTHSYTVKGAFVPRSVATRKLDNGILWITFRSYLPAKT
jgi:hypothetical protein